MSIAAGVFKCKYFRDSACHKTSNEIIMREPRPGGGETWDIFASQAVARLYVVENHWQWNGELRKASGLGISVCSIVSRVSHGWYRSGETSCTA